MTIQEIFDLAIKMGIAADPRGKKGVDKALARVKRQYEELPKSKQEDFDRENLTNPYSDTRILYGDSSFPVQKVMAGIDIDAAEVILADRLNEKGEGIDLLIAHHPHGGALAALDEVMDLQVDMLASYGVPINVAEGIMAERIAQVRRRLGPINHYRSVDAARVLNFPYICIHTPFDSLGWKFVTNEMDKKNPETVGDVMKILRDIPEYKIAIKAKSGPAIYAGTETGRAGKVVVGGFTGGTEGAKEIYEKLAQAGIGTVIGMHASDEHRDEAKKHHINLVIAGHVVSDSIGENLFLDELEKRNIQIVPASGLIRVSRNNPKKKS